MERVTLGLRTFITEIIMLAQLCKYFLTGFNGQFTINVFCSNGLSPIKQSLYSRRNSVQLFGCVFFTMPSFYIFFVPITLPVSLARGQRLLTLSLCCSLPLNCWKERKYDLRGLYLSMGTLIITEMLIQLLTLQRMQSRVEKCEKK